MDRKKPDADVPKPAPGRRAPYRQPTLRPYGSIQSLTLALNVMALTMDGPGGGGKTAL